MMQYQDQQQQSFDVSNGMSGNFVTVSDPGPAPMTTMTANPSDLGVAPAPSYDDSDGGASLMDAAIGVENGQSGITITDDAPGSTGGQVSAGQLMDAANDSGLGSVDDEVGANLDVGGMDILGDSFADGDNNNGQNQPQQQTQQGNIRTPQPLDLSNPPPADDNLWNKITGFMGGGGGDDKMASVQEAVDQYKTDQQNAAAQGVGLDKSMEYRGMQQQAEPQRGGRGGMGFRF